MMRCLIAAACGAIFFTSASAAVYVEGSPGDFYFETLALDLGTNTISGQIGIGGSGAFGTGAWYEYWDDEFFTLTGPSGTYVVDFTLTFANAVFDSEAYDLTGNLDAGFSLNAGAEAVSGVAGILSAAGTPLGATYNESSAHFGEVLGEFPGSNLFVSLYPRGLPLSLTNPPGYYEAYGYSASADWTLTIELAEKTSTISTVPLPATSLLLVAGLGAFAAVRRR